MKKFNKYGAGHLNQANNESRLVNGQYQIKDMKAIALIEWLGMIMTVNMTKVGWSSEQIQIQAHDLQQKAGGIYIKFGMDGLKQLVLMFIDDQNQKAKQKGMTLILPEYNIMHEGKWFSAKEIVFA
jgi:hypothetical protein